MQLGALQHFDRNITEYININVKEDGLKQVDRLPEFSSSVFFIGGYIAVDVPQL
jgi:hypothetical protein